jgi:phosphoglycolate phosphatase
MDARRETIFIDLDGTLTDPREGIVRSIHHALTRLEVPIPENDDLCWCIGPPLRQSFATLVGETRAAAALALYRERYAALGWRENRPYPDVAAVLATLNASGRSLHVATSKPQVFAERILEHFELGQYFHGVFGAELDGTRSDKGELLAFALEATAARGNATMVGDRRYDILGARQNGLRAIGVTYGFGDRQELVAAGADVVVGSPREWGAVLAGGPP